jgi:hypothetical protein
MSPPVARRSLRTLLALLLSLAAAPLVAACAHTRSDTVVCPEYRNMRCVTGPQCTLDRRRGCEVCQCEDALMQTDPKDTPADDDSRPADTD